MNEYKHYFVFLICCVFGWVPLGLPLIGSILRVCQYQNECKDGSANKEDEKDEHLETVAEITAEFLADLFIHIQKVILKEFILLTFVGQIILISSQ